MKKRILSICSVILALVMCISLMSCSKNDKPKDKVVDGSVVTTDSGDGNENAVPVTDKDGNIISPTDSQGNVIAPTDENGNVVEGNKVDKVDGTTDAKNTSDKNKKDDKDKNKDKEKDKDKDKDKDKESTSQKSDKTTTTTTTIHYTTVNSLDNNLGEEISLDDNYALTANGAMFRLQQKYDPNIYVVNLIEETNDYATLYVFVLENNEIYSKAKVNLKNGKTTETITKTKKKLTYTL